MSLTMNEYQATASQTIADTVRGSVTYTALSLAEEAGEVAAVIGKSMRKGVPFDQDKLIDEAGDVLWQLTKLATDLGVPLEHIARRNLEKLAERQQAGTIDTIDRSVSVFSGDGVYALKNNWAVGLWTDEEGLILANGNARGDGDYHDLSHIEWDVEGRAWSRDTDTGAYRVPAFDIA